VVDVSAVRFNLKGGGAYTLNLPEGGDVEGLLAYVANQHVLTLVDQTTGAHGTFWTRDLTSVDVNGEVALVPRGRTREAPAPTMTRIEQDQERTRSAAEQQGQTREEPTRATRHAEADDGAQRDGIMRRGWSM
jgi:hypothetical protein